MNLTCELGTPRALPMSLIWLWRIAVTRSSRAFEEIRGPSAAEAYGGQGIRKRCLEPRKERAEPVNHRGGRRR
jgi:hypothetical protein